MKKYSLVFLFIFVVVLMVIIRSAVSGGFMNHADQGVMPSYGQKNMISPKQLKALPKDVLLVELTTTDSPVSKLQGGVKQIPVADILEKNNLKTIQHHQGAVVLHSSDLALAAKIWMILSQTGKSDLYILADSLNNEVLKYKFRPDSIIRPE